MFLFFLPQRVSFEVTKWSIQSSQIRSFSLKKDFSKSKRAKKELAALSLCHGTCKQLFVTKCSRSSFFFYNSCLIRWIQQNKIYKELTNLVMDWTLVTYLAVSHSNPYIRMISALVWDCKWILIHAWVIYPNSSNWIENSFWKKLDCVVHRPNRNQLVTPEFQLSINSHAAPCAVSKICCDNSHC